MNNRDKIRVPAGQYRTAFAILEIQGPLRGSDLLNLSSRAGDRLIKTKFDRKKEELSLLTEAKCLDAKIAEKELADLCRANSEISEDSLQRVAYCNRYSIQEIPVESVDSDDVVISDSSTKIVFAAPRVPAEIQKYNEVKAEEESREAAIETARKKYMTIKILDNALKAQDEVEEKFKQAAEELRVVLSVTQWNVSKIIAAREKVENSITACLTADTTRIVSLSKLYAQLIGDYPQVAAALDDEVKSDAPLSDYEKQIVLRLKKHLSTTKDVDDYRKEIERIETQAKIAAACRRSNNLYAGSRVRAETPPPRENSGRDTPRPSN